MIDDAPSYSTPDLDEDSNSRDSSSSSGSYPLVAGTVYRFLKNKRKKNAPSSTPTRAIEGYSKLFYIVGDEAYICNDYLITPVAMSRADTDEDNFNFFLSSLRMHAEQAFGMLVARWRILKGGLNFTVGRSTNIVCLCMKLHNYVIENDKERSVLRQALTDHEKEQIKVDINEWITVSKDTAREFQDRRGGQRCEHGGTLLPTSRSSTSTMRERLIQRVKDKERSRPNVPLRPYSVDLE